MNDDTKNTDNLEGEDDIVLDELSDTI